MEVAPGFVSDDVEALVDELFGETMSKEEAEEALEKVRIREPVVLTSR